MKTIQVTKISSGEEPITVLLTAEPGNLDMPDACTHMGAMDAIDYDNVKNGFKLDGFYQCDKCGAVNEWGKWEGGYPDLNEAFWENNIVCPEEDMEGDC